MKTTATTATTCSTATFRVVVEMPGFGRFTGGTFCKGATFRDERKARDYYTDMLLRYPRFEVKLEKC